MFKSFICAAIFSLIFCAGTCAAADIYVGTSPATGRNCFIITETIGRTCDGHMFLGKATLKTVNAKGDIRYIEYEFFAQNGDVRCTNSEGYDGSVTEQDTPIEWAMYKFIKDY